MESLKQYLIQQAEACKSRADVLTADDRRDDAIFEKIRGNVYDIFLSVANAAEKTADPMAFFRARLADIPVNWEVAREKATLHGDVNRAHTESVKLEAIQAIRARLEVEA
ncbi:MAG: hypothetical protein IKD27_04710 [Oscillospiraceae bacterium]|nr:hypothetical protein [Oscillospiraceae bacterium]